MLDLQKAVNEKYEIKWLDGSVLRLDKPTRAMELSFLDLRDKDMDEKMAQEFLYNLMFRIFSKREPVYIEKKGFINKLKKKKELLEITKEDIEKINYDILFVTLQEYFEFYYQNLKMGE
ncbi:hypothetical protein [Anaerotignum sp.]|uniref:hypothetical protein n=1 Tax=Anaerotignum sp. TaxID=2039241 RepID=UPI0033177518